MDPGRWKAGADCSVVRRIKEFQLVDLIRIGFITVSPAFATPEVLTLAQASSRTCFIDEYFLEKCEVLMKMA